MSYKVSFIGLGVMGYPMAGYISKAGHNMLFIIVQNQKLKNGSRITKDNWLRPPKMLLKMLILFLHVLEMTKI